MFGISSTELMIIVIFGFLLFGPDKLPQMGRTLGRALRQFRETQEKMTSVVQAEVIDPMAAAASAPVKPKKASSAASAPVSADDDSDLESVGEAAPRRKETFAERRARLAAEKAEKEAAAAQTADAQGELAAEPVAAAEPAAESAAEPVAAAEPVPAAEPVAEPAPVEEEPAVRTTEDLYARRPRKRKPAADEPAATDAAGEDSSSSDAAEEGGEQ